MKKKNNTIQKNTKRDLNTDQLYFINFKCVEFRELCYIYILAFLNLLLDIYIFFFFFFF